MLWVLLKGAVALSPFSVSLGQLEPGRCRNTLSIFGTGTIELAPRTGESCEIEILGSAASHLTGFGFGMLDRNGPF